MYRSFEELEVWKRACRLCVDLYKKLKPCTDLSLRDQMQRAAISIASNIAEGAERGTTKEFSRYLRIAKGSAGELRTQLYIAEKIEILDTETRRALSNEAIEIGRMLQGLIASLDKDI